LIVGRSSQTTQGRGDEARAGPIRRRHDEQPECDGQRGNRPGDPPKVLDELRQPVLPDCSAEDAGHLANVEHEHDEADSQRRANGSPQRLSRRQTARQKHERDERGRRPARRGDARRLCDEQPGRRHRQDRFESRSTGSAEACDQRRRGAEQEDRADAAVRLALGDPPQNRTHRNGGHRSPPEDAADRKFLQEDPDQRRRHRAQHGLHEEHAGFRVRVTGESPEDLPEAGAILRMGSGRFQREADPERPLAVLMKEAARDRPAVEGERRSGQKEESDRSALQSRPRHLSEQQEQQGHSTGEACDEDPRYGGAIASGRIRNPR
jgi:hypothetical protein